MADDEDPALSDALIDALQTAGRSETAPTTSGLRRLSGGASRETWSFETSSHRGGAPRRLILQRTRPGASFSGPTMEAEDHLLAAAEAKGVPVPAIVANASTCAAAGLGEARVTAFVDGEVLGPRIVRGDAFAPARRVLLGQCARALAAVHGIDVTTVPGLETIDPLTRLRDGLDLLDEARPAFEVAMRWLAEHRPPSRPTTVVHGDFRVGNLLVDPDQGLRAVLDWELAHLGDPLEDLGWLCVRAWRFGGDGEVGGIGHLQQLIDAYADASGRPVQIDHVRWWIVAGTLTWGLICAVQARRHLDGQVRSVELAAIGRRVTETEYDLCQLLAIGTTTPAREGDAPERPDMDQSSAHSLERPTAAELVAAVRAHLTEQVAPSLDGSAAFQLRVAANALAIVERELLHGPRSNRRATEELGPLGCSDERELAGAIRQGTADGGGLPVADTVRSLVVDRLRIANPRWLQPPDR